MSKKITIVGICGYARSGKDTFCELLSKKAFTWSSGNSTQFKRYAFADRLKADLRGFIMEQAKIDINTIPTENKHLVRPMMIAYGGMMRNLGDGLHWVKVIDDQIQTDIKFDSYFLNQNYIPVITDFRYENEVLYFKERYNLILTEVIRKDAPTPPDEELQNHPKVKRHVNYTVDWPTVGENHLNILQKYADEFTKEFKLV